MALNPLSTYRVSHGVPWQPRQPPAKTHKHTRGGLGSDAGRVGSVPADHPPYLTSLPLSVTQAGRGRRRHESVSPEDAPPPPPAEVLGNMTAFQVCISAVVTLPGITVNYHFVVMRNSGAAHPPPSLW